MKSHNPHKGIARSHYKYPPQDPDEFEALCQIVRKKQPKRILEIGSRHGRSILRISEAAMPSLQFVQIIDMPGGPWGADGSDEALNQCAEDLRERNVNASVFLGNSQGSDAAQFAIDNEGYFDFAFIDGDHTYDGVLADYERFRPCMAEGSVMTFHDVCAPPTHLYRGRPLGVPKLWAKLCLEYEEKAVTLHSIGSKFGIGVLFL